VGAPASSTVHEWQPPWALSAGRSMPLHARSENRASMFEEGPCASSIMATTTILTLALARLGVLPFFWYRVPWWFVLLGAALFQRVRAVVRSFCSAFLPRSWPTRAGPKRYGAHGFPGCRVSYRLIWGGASSHPGIDASLSAVRHKHRLAMLSKFPTLAFFPAGAGLALAWYSPPSVPSWAGWSAPRGKGYRSLGLAVPIACLLIWGGYRFSFNKVPAPELFQGIQDVMRHNAEGHPVFLLGERSNTALLVFLTPCDCGKDAVAFLLLLAGGVTLAVRKRQWFRRAGPPLAFSPALCWWACSPTSTIGVRLFLPVYIGFSLLAAAAAIDWLEWARAEVDLDPPSPCWWSGWPALPF